MHRGEDRRGVAARGRRTAWSTPQAVATSHAGRGVGDRPAAGQQVGQRTGLQRAALAGPPRHPGEPGAGRRRPAARPRTARRGRRRAARRPGSRHRRRAPRQRPGRVVARRARRAPRPRRPARPASSVPDSLSSPRVANGAIGVHLQAALRTALRSRRNTIGDSSSGSKPDEQHRRAPAPGRRRSTRQSGCPATCAARNVGLLGRVRPGPEVDVVGAQHHPGELRVGVGVLDGRAGRRRARRRRRAAAASPRGRDVERLRPGRRLAASPSSSRTSGVVMRSPRGGVLERPAALVAVPLLVDLRVVAGQPAQHLSAPVVGALRAARRAVLAHARAWTPGRTAGPGTGRRRRSARRPGRSARCCRRSTTRTARPRRCRPAAARRAPAAR